MYQLVGSGSQISPTVEIDEVINRFKQFPQIAANSAVAFETEVATYDTLPLPLPTPEEQDDFVLALSDARDKKLRYIQTRNDLDFALRNPSFFQGLPSTDALTAASAAYTKLINAVMEHAIALSRGQITPPRLFDPSTLTPPLAEPGPIALQRVPPPPEAALVAVPNVTGIAFPPSAPLLIRKAGLTAQEDSPIQFTAADGQVMDGEIIGQDPAPGTMVAQASVVVLHIGNYHPHPAFIQHLGHAHPT